MTTWDDGQEQLHDELLDFTIVDAYHISRGLTEFPAWSKACWLKKAENRFARFSA
jgi:hypothetical protein